MNPLEPVYLGDSVYVTYVNGSFRLCTNNGTGDTNVIHIDVDVLTEMMRYFDRLDRHLSLKNQQKLPNLEEE